MATNVLELVATLAPRAKSNYVEAISQGGELFEEHGVTTDLRVAHFLAQALHETGGFTVLRESMKYSAKRLVQIFGVGRHSAAITPEDAARLVGHPEDIAERVYGLGNPLKSSELGNTQAGDGFRYRGNGILQTTGRANHREAGELCGVDFEGSPELVTDPAHALKPALFEWTKSNLNTYADANDIRTITRRINGGLIGLDERVAWFNEIWATIGSSETLPSPR